MKTLNLNNDVYAYAILSGKASKNVVVNGIEVELVTVGGYPEAHGDSMFKQKLTDVLNINSDLYLIRLSEAGTNDMDGDAKFAYFITKKIDNARSMFNFFVSHLPRLGNLNGKISRAYNFNFNVPVIYKALEEVKHLNRIEFRLVADSLNYVGRHGHFMKSENKPESWKYKYVRGNSYIPTRSN